MYMPLNTCSKSITKTVKLDSEQLLRGLLQIKVFFKKVICIYVVIVLGKKVRMSLFLLKLQRYPESFKGFWLYVKVSDLQNNSQLTTVYVYVKIGQVSVLTLRNPQLLFLMTLGKSYILSGKKVDVSNHVNQESV